MQMQCGLATHCIGQLNSFTHFSSIHSSVQLFTCAAFMHLIIFQTHGDILLFLDRILSSELYPYQHAHTDPCVFYHSVWSEHSLAPECCQQCVCVCVQITHPVPLLWRLKLRAVIILSGPEPPVLCVCAQHYTAA